MIAKRETLTSKWAEMSPIDRVEQLTQLASRLLDLLQSEMQVLEACKPMDVVQFHEEKTRLTNEFSLQVNFLQKNPHLLDQAPAERVSSLKSLMQSLQDRSEKTSKMLLAAKSVSDGIMRELAANTAKVRMPQTGYGRTGAMAAAPKASSMPLSLDSSI